MRRIACSLLLAILALAQQQNAPAPAPGGAKPVTFSATSQLVEETVTVKDRNGKVIEGLTAKDFVVTEDGVPQTIKICSFQKLTDEPLPPLPKTPAPAAAAADTKPPVPGVTATQIAPEPPGEIHYQNRRLMVMYFDMSAMPQADQMRAQAAAYKFITTQMTPPDLMAVMDYNGASVQVLQDFTNDRDQLLTVLTKLFIGEGQGLDELNADDSAADTGSAFGEDDSEFNLFNTDRQLSALQTAVKMLGTLNEKKVLVYFASGLQLNGVDNQAQFQATTQAALKANVVFYTVDARGLVATPPLGDATHGSPGSKAMYSGSSAMAFNNNFQKSQDTLYGLASDTGGKALLDNNDLSRGVVMAQQSVASYYIIGYYSSNQALDGKFRRIKITLANGNEGAKLEYRQGYFGGREWNKFTTADKERQLLDALMQGDFITDLTIQMEVNYFQLNSAEYYVPLVAKIPGSELALARRRGAEHTEIVFIGEVKDEYNATITNLRDHVDVKLSGETAAELAHRPIEYEAGFVVLPGTYSIKLLARDEETGRIGTYMTKFTIPNLNKVQERIPISSVVLSGQRVDRRDALYTANKSKTPSVDPLIQDGIELMPSVTRVFSRRNDMYIYLQAYQRGATPQQPLVAFVTFYRGQTKAFETPPLGVTEELPNRLKTVPLKFDLSLSKLPPGKYDCQVTVLDPTGKKAAFWQAPVMLVQ
ncbi:MAG TPA: VWA domain-containing protein [Bryobacteraceae bacterium]|nr:VWA domain-containing protein [Bryobacteraceae bacterium]